MGAFSLELWQALQRFVSDLEQQVLFKGSLLGLVGFLVSGLTETTYNTAVVKMTLYFVLGLALAVSRHEAS